MRQDIPITIKGDPTAGTLACEETGGSADLTSLEAWLYASLVYMRRVSFSRPLPWTTESLSDWFRTAIRGIVVEVGTGYPYCTPSEKVIHIFVSASPFDTSLSLHRINPEGLIHEARHAEGPYHTCGGGTKDRTIAEMGAFGVQYRFLEGIANHSAESEDDRDYFRWRMYWLRGPNAFCDECTR